MASTILFPKLKHGERIYYHEEKRQCLTITGINRCTSVIPRRDLLGPRGHRRRHCNQTCGFRQKWAEYYL